MTDVFISYDRDDRADAARIAQALERKGWSVWWDRNILGGETFEHTIQRALADARCVLVLWSTSSVASSWVKDEAAEGARRGILVPVLIDSVPIPLGFRQLHAVMLPRTTLAEENTSDFDDLIKSVEHVLRRSAAPASSTSPIAAVDSGRASSGSATLPTFVHQQRHAGAWPGVSRSSLMVIAVVAALALAVGWRWTMRDRTDPSSAPAVEQAARESVPTAPTTGAGRAPSR